MATIELVVARRSWTPDNPTLECDVHLDDGGFGRAVVPSGASTGQFEAVELRDGGDRYGGKVLQRRSATSTRPWPRTSSTRPDPYDQRAVDQVLIDADGTDGQAQANATLGVSMAVARAAADSSASLYQSLGGLAPTCSRCR